MALVTRASGLVVAPTTSMNVKPHNAGTFHKRSTLGRWVALSLTVSVALALLTWRHYRSRPYGEELVQQLAQYRSVDDLREWAQSLLASQSVRSPGVLPADKTEGIPRLPGYAAPVVAVTTNCASGERAVRIDYFAGRYRSGLILGGTALVVNPADYPGFSLRKLRDGAYVYSAWH